MRWRRMAFQSRSLHHRPRLRRTFSRRSSSSIVHRWDAFWTLLPSYWRRTRVFDAGAREIARADADCCLAHHPPLRESSRLFGQRLFWPRQEHQLLLASLRCSPSSISWRISALIALLMRDRERVDAASAWSVSVNGCYRTLSK